MKDLEWSWSNNERRSVAISSSEAHLAQPRRRVHSEDSTRLHSSSERRSRGRP
jgi:hypothetical protein